MPSNVIELIDYQIRRDQSDRIARELASPRRTMLRKLASRRPGEDVTLTSAELAALFAEFDPMAEETLPEDEPKSLYSLVSTGAPVKDG